MTGREQAIKDVAAALGCDDLILSQFICNNGEYKVYAVSQRERVIQLERALRLLLSDELFQVTIGGNPNVVDKFLSETRKLLLEGK